MEYALKSAEGGKKKSKIDDVDLAEAEKRKRGREKQRLSDPKPLPTSPEG